MSGVLYHCMSKNMSLSSSLLRTHFALHHMFVVFVIDLAVSYNVVCINSLVSTVYKQTGGKHVL